MALSPLTRSLLCYIHEDTLVRGGISCITSVPTTPRTVGAMILLCLATICLVLVLLLLKNVYETATYWKNKGIPYESYLSYLHYFLFRQNREDIFDMLRDYTKKYGPIYGTYQGLNPILRVTSPDGIKDAFSRNFSKAHARTTTVQTGTPLWDHNALALEYPEWKMVRSLSGQVLTGSKLKYMKGKFEQVAKRVAAKLAKLAKTHAEISTQAWAHGTVMNATAAVTFSLEVDAIEDPNHMFIKNCTGIFKNSWGLTLLFSFPKLLRYLPFVQYPVREVEVFFVKFTETVLKQRRQQPHRSEDSDVLDSWLETQKNNPELTDAVLTSQMFLFFVAGYETSAYTMMFLLHLLATHPEKQEAVYENIVENVSDRENITLDQYNKMKLLEAAIYETLRLYPTDHGIDRITTSPCTIAGVTLDVGVNIQCPMSSVQDDPERFYEPLQFRPERFIDGGEKISDLVSFGLGPKNCVGERLAMTQLLIFLANILLKVRLEPPSDGSYDPSLEYQPKIKRVPGQLFLPFPQNDLKVTLALRK